MREHQDLTALWTNDVSKPPIPQENEELYDKPPASFFIHVTSSRVDMAITSVKRGDDRILSLLPVRCLVYTKGNLGNLMAVIQINRALALWHLPAADSLSRGCAVTTLHVDVLLVREVDVGLGWRDCDGCHGCGGKGYQMVWV